MKALVIGLFGALATLVVLGWGLAFMASGGGLLLMAFLAIVVGATVAHIIDTTTSDRNLGVIVVIVLALIAGYILTGSNQPVPPGTLRGGPNIPAPPAR